ncbi:hypothetical protein CspeluHIS016_0803580 [Cutaneotrichosporon spelunceum]|uniref:Uncharacterized protein n=1 Tax=Cutaneotrichosporon spelunceum TaxID=1672016 RepID=A0AAD3YF98_9TREE|nr:hypothetical protein CspeluHIS016_0803580 [Cutaneotrichosporon spelunceum]
MEAAWAVIGVSHSREVLVNFSDNVDLNQAAAALSSKMPEFTNALTHILKYFSPDELDVWAEHLQHFISILDDWEIRMVLKASEDSFPAKGAWVVAIGRRFYTAIEHEPNKYFRLSGYRNGCPRLLELVDSLRFDNQANSSGGDNGVDGGESFRRSPGAERRQPTGDEPTADRAAILLAQLRHGGV